MSRRYLVVDVFTHQGGRGNPVAVVLDGDGLTEDQMLGFARWTNLSETTFVVPPTSAQAEYGVRIFTPTGEMPFAGHPTLGTCHAWMETTGANRSMVVHQECRAGLVPVRSTPEGLSFATPPLVRSGPVEDELLSDLATELALRPRDIVAGAWVDNGPGWVALLLKDVRTLRELRPIAVTRPVGVVSMLGPQDEAAYEVRAFAPSSGGYVEDAVTGSLNGSVAQWLVGQDLVHPPYLVSQGRCVARDGVVHIDEDDDGGLWVGGQCLTVVRGTVDV